MLARILVANRDNFLGPSEIISWTLLVHCMQSWESNISVIAKTSFSTLATGSSLESVHDTENGGESPQTKQVITPSPEAPELNVWVSIEAPIALTSDVVSIALPSSPVQVATHLSSSLKTGLLLGIVNLLFFSVAEPSSDVSSTEASSKSSSIAVSPDTKLEL